MKTTLDGLVAPNASDAYRRAREELYAAERKALEAIEQVAPHLLQRINLVAASEAPPEWGESAVEGCGRDQPYACRMRSFVRSAFAVVATFVILGSLAMTARADVQVSGTYRIVTGTGKHMIVTLVQNGDDQDSVDGTYVGNQGVAGRLHGTWSHDGSMMSYTWEERKGDYFNPSTKRGWGNMSWSSDGRRMQARWGFDGDSTSVGLWNATLIDP